MLVRVFSYCLFLYVVLYIGWVECKGSSGGGGRGSSGGRSSSPSSGRSSSPSSGRSSSSLSGTASRSSSAGGSAKYSRAYGLTYPSTYYFMYYSYRPTTQYIGSPSSADGNGSVCRNFDASENDTYLGTFVCPLPFEPENYISCCGDEDAQYCCEKPASASFIIGIIASVVFVTVALAVWLMCRFKRARKIENLRRAQTSAQQPPPNDEDRLHELDDVTVHYKPPDVIDVKPPSYEESVEPPPPYSEKVERSS